MAQPNKQSKQQGQQTVWISPKCCGITEVGLSTKKSGRIVDKDQKIKWQVLTTRVTKVEHRASSLETRRQERQGKSCVLGESPVWTLKSPRMMTGVIATWNPEDRCKSMVLRGHELHQHPGGSVLIQLSFSSNRQHNSIHSRCVRGRVRKQGWMIQNIIFRYWDQEKGYINNSFLKVLESACSTGKMKERLVKY